jgi:hypothetical protein
MLLKLRDLNGRIVEGRDGKIGTIRAACFDGQAWTVRYWVLDTDGRFGNKELPVSTAAVPDQDFNAGLFCSRLTAEQVQQAPVIDLSKPAPLLEEQAAAEYYGWPRYWENVAAAHENYAEESGGITCAVAERTGPPLYDSRAFTGYNVIASDGGIGRVDDFISDSSNWRIRYFIVDTFSMPGRKVLVAPRWVINVNTFRAEVHVNIAQGLLMNGPEYDPAVPIDQQFERRFCAYYGLPENWC